MFCGYEKFIKKEILKTFLLKNGNTATIGFYIRFYDIKEIKEESIFKEKGNYFLK